MPSTSRVLAVGELLWDLLPGGARLGGALANFAIGCARLGHPASVVTCLGKDTLGRQALAELATSARGLDFDESLVQTSTELPTGTVDVLLAAGGHPAYTIVEPVAWDSIAVTDAALAVAEAAKALCFGSLAQRNEPSRSSIRQLVRATPSGCIRVFDANVRLPFCNAEIVRWSLGEATVVKISEEELELVISYLDLHDLRLHGEATPHPELERAANAVLDYAPRCELVAITLGPRGSLLVSRCGSHYHPGFRVQVRDTVGAGDAFTSGLTHALLSGASLATMNRVGNLCGSFVASQSGATPPYPAALLGEIQTALDPTPQPAS